MASFLKGNELNSALEKIFDEAEDLLILISPYIKLHHRFESVLKSKISNDKLKIFIVFGKNEGNIAKSLSGKDLDFFKQFPNIEIRYEKRLHAKFYANETSQILTSMNLYDFSQDENIEAGVKTEINLLNNLASNIVGKNLDQEAWEYFNTVVDSSELLFKNEPEYETKWDGIRKKFKLINNKVDKISEHFTTKINSEITPRIGYCIRSGEKIPFNPSKPFSEKAYESWLRYKNDNYPEKFCHKTGKPSNGKTTKANPILN
ncbi:MAG TPA: phospholipase D family protein [Bacteroidia bacterium]|jgi:hypothetical protein|nr:phospholipase D family protein [Bacteroidia bacterium]